MFPKGGSKHHQLRIKPNLQYRELSGCAAVEISGAGPAAACAQQLKCLKEGPGTISLGQNFCSFHPRALDIPTTSIPAPSAELGKRHLPSTTPRLHIIFPIPRRGLTSAEITTGSVLSISGNQ